MCLQAQGIDDDEVDGRLSKYDGCVGGGQGIDDASKESETTIEAAKDRRQPRRIYDYGGGVDGGR